MKSKIENYIPEYYAEDIALKIGLSRLLTATKIRKYYLQDFLKRKAISESEVTVIDNQIVELFEIKKFMVL